MHKLRRQAISGMHFQRIDKVPARMGPTTRMHHTHLANVVVSSVPVSLQYALIIAQENARNVAASPQRKPEYHWTLPSPIGARTPKLP